VPARRRPSTRAAALPARGLPQLGQLIPSARSVGAGLVLLALAVGGYVGARETSVFAVRTIDVRGGTPVLRAEVRAALAGEVGASLLKVDGGALAERIAPLPAVRAFSYDRSFPHTLRVVLQREVPVMVVRQVPGTAAFLVAASGKVIGKLAHPRLSSLPRLWVRNTVQLTVGQPLPPALAGASAALAVLRGAGLPGGVTTVEAGRDELTLKLAGGFEIRLGDPGDLRLKLAIARRILRATGAATSGATYLDVSVPERPVVFDKSQVVG
jgi:cell division protein FtsQ